MPWTYTCGIKVLLAGYEEKCKYIENATKTYFISVLEGDDCEYVGDDNYLHGAKRKSTRVYVFVN